MRQYRGLTKDGKWVYGWYAEVEGVDLIIPSFKGNDSKLRPYLNSTGFIGVINIHKAIEVVPETVGQSLGRKDKSNKEIYEGDIIKGTVHDLKSCSEEKRPDLWSEYIVRFGVGEVDASDFEQYEVEIIGFYLEKVKLNNWAADSILGLNGIEIIGTIHDKE